MTPPDQKCPAGRWYNGGAHEDDHCLAELAFRWRTTDMRAERDIYDGGTPLGVVRERSDRSVVAVVDEQVLGAFDTITGVADTGLQATRQMVAP